MPENLSLEELKPFLPEWFWELKRKITEKQKKSVDAGVNLHGVYLF